VSQFLLKPPHPKYCNLHTAKNIGWKDSQQERCYEMLKYRVLDVTVCSVVGDNCVLRHFDVFLEVGNKEFRGAS